jgi:hypothetical protein
VLGLALSWRSARGPAADAAVLMPTPVHPISSQVHKAASLLFL